MPQAGISIKKSWLSIIIDNQDFSQTAAI